MKKYKDRRDWLLHEPLEFREAKPEDFSESQKATLLSYYDELLKNNEMTEESYNEFVKRYRLK